MGLIKAVKFRGTYYKFDPDFNIVDKLLNPTTPKSEEEVVPIITQTLTMASSSLEPTTQDLSLSMGGGFGLQRCRDPMTVAADFLRSEQIDEELEYHNRQFHQSFDTIMQGDNRAYLEQESRYDECKALQFLGIEPQSEP